MINESPSVQPSFCDDATSVTMAKPNSPSADGSAKIQDDVNNFVYSLSKGK